MPIDKINETAITGTSGVEIPVRVLNDNGTTARVQLEGPGIHLKQGQVHTVNSDEVKPIR